MDDLDREIEEAVRLTRARVWRGRLATIASVGTFFLVGIAGTIAVFTLFPEPDESDFDAKRRGRDLTHEEPTAAIVAGDYAAQRHDQGRMRMKVLPVIGLAFACAYFVSKRFKPAG